jgi:lipoprotein-anchoring transpeptidase ErfK/SrfK
LPYEYGRAASQATAIYNGIPTSEEQEALNPSRVGQVPPPEWKTSSLGAVPEFLAGQRYSVGSSGERRPSTGIRAGRSVRDGGFAFLELFESDGRYFGLSTDFDVLPLAGLKRVVPSTFRGLVLGANAELPVAFVRSSQAYLYGGDVQRGLEPERPIQFREGFQLTGSKERIDGRVYHETRDGHWLLDSGLLVLIEAQQKTPSWATAGRTWIDVSLLKQTLVAYEGTHAVYASLVSTGVDGLGEPETTHSTVQGQYLIHTKHVSTQMKGDEEGDEFDLRDVPYVQYFNAGYALHAAYWHDSFGTPRSHGCINLSPQDAQWLFEWTEPHVPREWHGAMSLRDGTLVSVHP